MTDLRAALEALVKAMTGPGDIWFTDEAQRDRYDVAVTAARSALATPPAPSDVQVILGTGTSNSAFPAEWVTRETTPPAPEPTAALVSDMVENAHDWCVDPALIRERLDAIIAAARSELDVDRLARALAKVMSATVEDFTHAANVGWATAPYYTDEPEVMRKRAAELAAAYRVAER